jgi:hypothetical protein
MRISTIVRSSRKTRGGAMTGFSWRAKVRNRRHGDDGQPTRGTLSRNGSSRASRREGLGETERRGGNQHSGNELKSCLVIFLSIFQQPRPTRLPPPTRSARANRTPQRYQSPCHCTYHWWLLLCSCPLSQSEPGTLPLTTTERSGEPKAPRLFFRYSGVATAYDCD